MAVVTILGAGMMGSALAVPLIDRGHDVRLVGTHLDADIVASLRKDRAHPTLRHELPPGFRAYPLEELEEAMAGVDIVVLGVNSHGVHWAAERLAPYTRPGLPIAMITKGLEWDGSALRVLPDVVRGLLPEEHRQSIDPIGVTGPCIAGELARRVETCVVFSGRSAERAAAIADVMRSDYYHVWTSTDVRGHETCAALKNAYAMAIGFAHGLHEKRGGQPGSVALHNYESAVFAQSICEMQRLVSVVGGDPETAVGLSGVGDLDVTTNGGRTGRFGRWLGLGLTVPEAVEQMRGATLECLDIVRVVREALPTLEQQGVAATELPLMRHMAAVVLDGAPVEMPFAAFFADR